MKRAIVALMVLALTACSPPPVTKFELPTVDALTTYDDNTVSANVALEKADNRCIFATVNDTTAFTIWPSGTTQDAFGNVVLTDDNKYGIGAMFIGTVILTDRKTVAAASGGTLERMITFCQGDADEIAIIVSVDE